MPSIFTSGTYIIAEELMYSSYIYQDSIFVICDTSLAPVNIVLPSINEGKSFSTFILISDASENASTNNITISAAVGQTINNASSIIINADGGSCFCVVSSSSLNQIGGQPITSKWVALQSNSSGGGGFTTADNGLTANTSTNVQLGGTLITNTTITTSNASQLTISSSNGIALNVITTGTSQAAISASATSGAAAILTSSTGIGLVASSDGGGLAARFQSYLALVNNASVGVLKLRALTGVAPAQANFGASLEFELMTTNFGTSSNSNTIVSQWSDAAQATRTSKLTIKGYNLAVEGDVFIISGNGGLRLPSYGINTFTGTPAYLLGVNASGNVVETTSIAARNYGSFYDTTIQIASGVGQADAMKLNSTDSSATNGISIVNDTFGNPTKITVTKTSIYNIQFSAQLNRVGGGVLRQTSIWLRKNGSNVTYSNTGVVMQNSNQKQVAAWNFVESLIAGDFLELVAYLNGGSSVLFLAEGPLPTNGGVGVPSMIVTMTQVK